MGRDEVGSWRDGVGVGFFVCFFSFVIFFFIGYGLVDYPTWGELKLGFRDGVKRNDISNYRLFVGL